MLAATCVESEEAGLVSKRTRERDGKGCEAAYEDEELPLDALKEGHILEPLLIHVQRDLTLQLRRHQSHEMLTLLPPMHMPGLLEVLS